MSAFLRGGLLGAALVGVFLAGYVLRNPPSSRSDIAVEPVQQAVKPAPAVPARTTTDKLVPPPPIQLVSNKEEFTPKIDFETLAPPPISDPKAEPDPNDLAFQMVKKQLGIQTTILGEPEPVPAVLADAKKNDVPLPESIPLPKMGPTPRVSELTPPPPMVTFPDLPPAPVIDVPEIRNPKVLVKEREIALDFEITRMGFSKIVAVELWTTRDEGKTWQKTDRREGCESPFRTRLWSEGDYGFKMVFESETGMKTPEPKTGQTADFGVILDATPPKVTAPKLTKSDLQPRSVTIEWTSIDERPDDSFIRIEYSLDGTNWNEIPDVKPRSLKTGFDFKWSMPEDLPPRLQLRVTTRDQAGNYGTAQTSIGAIVDLLEPAGKITGIREENAKPEVGPRPREVVDDSRSKPSIPFADPYRPQERNAIPEVGPMPREIEGLSWLPRAEDRDALLSSLVLLGRQPTGWDMSGNETMLAWETFGASSGTVGYRLEDNRRSPFLVKEWLAELTNTIVGEDSTYQIPPFRRRNPFEPPVDIAWPVNAGEEVCELLCTVIWAGSDGYINARTGAPEPAMNRFGRYAGPANRNNARKRLQLEAEAIHDRLTHGESILKVVNDRTWKPSTASVESYRSTRLYIQY